MGFHEFSSPYDWSRIASYKRTAKAAFGGMVDLSVGSPVDPVPDSVRKALAVSSNDPNAYGYPVTAGTADLRDAIHEWFAAAAMSICVRSAPMRCRRSVPRKASR